ncbi:MAG: hypothetical protein QM765_13720 [Myxococcales bacterium]
MDERSSAAVATKWLSLGMVAIGAVYVVLIAYGIATAEPGTGRIRDSVRILMELVTMAAGVVLMALGAALHLWLESRRLLTLLGALFLTACGTVTCGVHFVSLTVADALVRANPGLEPLLTLGWPSVLMSLDILAWDLLFGLGFLLLGWALIGAGGRAVGALMVASGALSIAGLIALPLGMMQVRFVGVFGYTVLPVVACGLLVRFAGKPLDGSP